MTFDAFLHQLPDADAAETGEWLESLDALVASEGTVRARFVIGKLLERARRLQVPVPSLVSTPYINTIPPDEEPWFPGDEEMERRIRRIVRWNAAAMVTTGEQAQRRHRWPSLDVRVGGVALRGRLQPLLPRQGRRQLRRPDLLPGARGAGHVLARLPRGPDHRGADGQLPSGDGRQRAQLVSASAPDARLLGVPDGVHGPRAAQRHLPGAVQPLPLQPAHRGHEREPRLVLPRRWRVRRAGDARRAVPGRARAARQPHLRRQLQPAASRWTGARQRQGHPGARGNLPRAPAGTSSR